MTELAIPAFMIPSWRTQMAIDKGVEQKIMLRTWGGIGDQICAEPAIRFAIKTFKNCRIFLASEAPELFRHLEFEKVFNLKEHQPIWDQYLTFDMIRPPSDLSWEFMSHMIVNCVDYCSLCAFRCMLPIAEREVRLDSPALEETFYIEGLLENRKSQIVIHPGKHWQSKTFPKDWWDEVIGYLVEKGITPILIGANTDDNRGTVDVSTDGCLDLRNKLSLMESVALLKQTKVLLTNDSSPLHMAVDSDAWILFVATVKHPDYIMHWRKGQWAWRMQNHGKGGIWDVINYCPNVQNKIEVENVGDELLRSWLPNPHEFAQAGIDKL